MPGAEQRDRQQRLRQPRGRPVEPPAVPRPPHPREPARAAVLLLPAPPGPLRGLCRSHVGLARRRVHVCPRQRLMHRARAAQNKRMVRDHVVRIFLSKSIRYDLVCIVLDIINENT